MGTVFALAGLCLVMGAVSALRTRSFLRDSVEASGSVRSTKEQTSYDENNNPSTSYRSVVEYSSSDGGVHTIKVSTPARLQPGTRVPVRYRAHRPHRGRVPFGRVGLWRNAIGFAGIGAVLAGIGAGLQLARR